MEKKEGSCICQKEGEKKENTKWQHPQWQNDLPNTRVCCMTSHLNSYKSVFSVSGFTLVSERKLFSQAFSLCLGLFVIEIFVIPFGFLSSSLTSLHCFSALLVTIDRDKILTLHSRPQSVVMIIVAVILEANPGPILLYILQYFSQPVAAHVDAKGMTKHLYVTSLEDNGLVETSSSSIVTINSLISCKILITIAAQLKVKVCFDTTLDNLNLKTVSGPNSQQ